MQNFAAGGNHSLWPDTLTNYTVVYGQMHLQIVLLLWPDTQTVAAAKLLSSGNNILH